jgi:hypothetical protein
MERGVGGVTNATTARDPRSPQPKLHQNRKDIHRYRDPRPGDWRAAALVDHDDVNPRVINLHDFERTGRGTCTRHRVHCGDGPTVSSPPRPHSRVNLLDASLNRPPGWGNQSGYAAAGLNLPNHAVQWRAGRFQIVPLNNLADQRFLPRLQKPGALLPAPGPLYRSRNRPLGLVALQEPINSRAT